LIIQTSCLLLAAAASGCTGLDPGLDTCADSKECVQTGVQTLEVGPPLYQRDQRWRCLAPDYQPPMPAQTGQPPDAFNYTAVLADYATGTPLTSAKMSFCLNMDSTCASAPQGMPIPNTPAINIQIRAGAEGFLRQEAEGHIIEDYYLLAPMLSDQNFRASPTDPFTLLSFDSLVGFVRDVGINVDQNLGIMALEIRDCDDRRVEGARLNLPDRATKTELQSADYYATDQRFPVIDVATDKDGVAGWVNLPEGTILVEAVVDGHTFGQTRLRIYGGRITAAVIRPVYLTGK
jgi:hypothetical protein